MLRKFSARTMANKKPHKVAAGAVPPALPPSVERAYRDKCIELKRRQAEVEQNNDSFRLRKNRLHRSIRKMRLERSMLLEMLGKRMRKNGVDGYYDYDSENSSEMPATVRPPTHITSAMSHAKISSCPAEQQAAAQQTQPSSRSRLSSDNTTTSAFRSHRSASSTSPSTLPTAA